MQSLKSEDHICKSLKRMLKKEGRINFELRELNELIKSHPQLHPLFRLTRRPLPALQAFKLLILLNRLLVESACHSPSLVLLLEGLSVVAEGEFQELLEKKLIQPYRLYLQRRAGVSERAGLVEGGEGARVYQLLNLINLGTSFADIIYTFGRYYLHRYGCAIDFNVTLGADLQLLYTEMVAAVARPASRHILEEIETVHERMYVVFYNCYFHKYLKPYVPKWVITDATELPKRPASPPTRTKTAQKTAASRSASLPRTPVASKKFERVSDLGDSCLFLNEKVEQVQELEVEIEENPEGEERKEQVKLLLSMERVVSHWS